MRVAALCLGNLMTEQTTGLRNWHILSGKNALKDNIPAQGEVEENVAQGEIYILSSTPLDCMATVFANS